MSEREAKKIRLKGHETFILREGWLAKGLGAVSDNPRVFSEYFGADALGVGTNMAKAIRYWLKAGGLTVDSKTGTELTAFGRAVRKYDPYFEDRFTLWIIHGNIACNASLATSWYVFFNRIGYEEYTKEELTAAIMQELCSYSRQQELPEASVAADVTAIVSMYSREKSVDYDPEEKRVSPFAELMLLKKSNGIYQKQLPDTENLPAMAVWYLIRRFFENEQTKSVSIDTLMKGSCLPGRIYNLNRIELNAYLDKLAAKGCIAVNRTAGLDMVYSLEDTGPDEVIEKYYSCRDRS